MYNVRDVVIATLAPLIFGQRDDFTNSWKIVDFTCGYDTNANFIILILEEKLIRFIVNDTLVLICYPSA